LNNVSVGVHRRAADHRFTGGNGAASDRKCDHGSSAEQFGLHDENSFPISSRASAPLGQCDDHLPYGPEIRVDAAPMHPFASQTGNPFEWTCERLPRHTVVAQYG
jgi:hypothetical protein